MPVFYVNLNEQKSLMKEPYVSFAKQYDAIKDDLNGADIEIRVGGNKVPGFSNGFYIDKTYYRNPKLKFSFATMPCADGKSKDRTLIRASYSYEVEDSYDLDYHIGRAKDIKKRAPYFYIPDASHFEFSHQIDDLYKLIFDMLVEDNEKIPNVCFCFISLIIAIFSLDE